jgi:hypothetical protein
MNAGSIRAAAPSLTDEDVETLDALVTSLAATRRGIAAFQAMEAQLLRAANALALQRVDGSRGDGDLPIREVAAEIGAALRVSDRTVQRQLGQAQILTESFAATHDALAAGRISRAHAMVIVEAGQRIEDAQTRAAYESTVLVVAERESATRLKGFAKLTAERLLPRTIDERHREAATGRRVDVNDLDDGMSELRLCAASPLVHGIHDRLTQQATAVRAAEPADDRTMDELRADLLCDMALTGDPAAHAPAELLGGIRAEVCLTVPVTTLAGVGDAPAMLDGTQPIDTEAALQLVGTASGWDRVLTHPVTGAVLAVDRYRPGADLRRYLRAIDQRCRFPGCMIPARRCDLDHIRDAAYGGPTEEGNLTDKCRRHHVLKHHTAWRSEKSRDGTIFWTGPTGRHYPDHTPGRVMFTPAPEAPPPF